MGLFSGIVVFLIVWWVVIFMVLPWGVRPAEKPEPGHEPGAPEKPMLLRKALITTAITAVIWLAIFAVIESDLISFRDMGRALIQQSDTSSQ